jgi:hypothetical protein
MSRSSPRATPPKPAPIDPARERARLAAAFAALPAGRQSDALKIVAEWPKLIHALARAGELADPVRFELARKQRQRA